MIPNWRFSPDVPALLMSDLLKDRTVVVCFGNRFERAYRRGDSNTTLLGRVRRRLNCGYPGECRGVAASRGCSQESQPSVPGRRQDRTLPPHDITFRHTGRYGFVPWLEPANSL